MWQDEQKLWHARLDREALSMSHEAGYDVSRQFKRHICRLEISYIRVVWCQQREVPLYKHCTFALTWHDMTLSNLMKVRGWNRFWVHTKTRLWYAGNTMVYNEQPTRGCKQCRLWTAAEQNRQSTDTKENQHKRSYQRNEVSHSCVSGVFELNLFLHHSSCHILNILWPPVSTLRVTVTEPGPRASVGILWHYLPWAAPLLLCQSFSEKERNYLKH